MFKVIICTLKIWFRSPQDNGCRLCFGKCLNQSIIYLFVQKQWRVQRQYGKTERREEGTVTHPGGSGSPAPSLNGTHFLSFHFCRWMHPSSVETPPLRRFFSTFCPPRCVSALSQALIGIFSEDFLSFWNVLMPLNRIFMNKMWVFSPRARNPLARRAFFIIDQSDALYVWMNPWILQLWNARKMWGRRKVLWLDSRLCSVPLNDAP